LNQPKNLKKEEYEEKEKDLKKIADPIIAKLYQQAPGAGNEFNSNTPNAEPMESNEQNGPKIEEVD